MNESAHGPTAPWLDRLLMAVLLVCVAVTAAYVVTAADGKTVLPAPLNSLLFVVLATTVLGILIRRARDEIIRHIDRRQTVIRSALVQHGVKLAEVTGEIPRITELPSPGPRDEDMNGYAMGYADGLARKPIVGKVVPFNRSQGS